MSKELQDPPTGVESETCDEKYQVITKISQLDELEEHTTASASKEVGHDKADETAECMIASQKVHCKNSSKGCKWTGELKELKVHLKTEPNKGGRIAGCEYQITSCKKCDEDMMYTELADHMKNSCEKRTVNCDYKFAGCDFKGSGSSMRSHYQDNMSHHLLLLSQLVKRKDSPKKCRSCFKFVFGLILLIIVISVLISITVSFHSSDHMEDVDSELKHLSEQLDTGQAHTILNSQLKGLSERLKTTKEQTKNLISKLDGHSERFQTLDRKTKTLKLELKHLSWHFRKRERRVGELETELKHLSERLQANKLHKKELDLLLRDVTEYLDTEEMKKEINMNVKEVNIRLTLLSNRLKTVNNLIGNKLDPQLKRMNSQLSTTETNKKAYDSKIDKVYEHYVTAEKDVKEIDKHLKILSRWFTAGGKHLELLNSKVNQLSEHLITGKINSTELDSEVKDLSEHLKNGENNTKDLGLRLNELSGYLKTGESHAHEFYSQLQHLKRMDSGENNIVAIQGSIPEVKGTSYELKERLESLRTDINGFRKTVYYKKMYDKVNSVLCFIFTEEITSYLDIFC